MLTLDKITEPLRGVALSPDGQIQKVWCISCSTEEPVLLDYVVKATTWEASLLDEHSGPLCLRCLEFLIGRPLTPEDFTQSIVNVCLPQRLALLHTPMTEEVLLGLRQEFQQATKDYVTRNPVTARKHHEPGDR